MMLGVGGCYILFVCRRVLHDVVCRRVLHDVGCRRAT